MSQPAERLEDNSCGKTATALEAVAAMLPERLPSLIGLSRTELTDALRSIGVAEKGIKMRVNQIWHWIYHQGAKDFDDMSNVSKALRAQLKEHFIIGRPEITADQKSSDGTRKWLLRFEDGNEVETVYIPDVGEERGTLCISSQVGCTLTCSFCHTGTQKLVRNLHAREIVAQFLIARDFLGEWPTPNHEGRLLSNVVMMGMGEPLFNYPNVKTAIEIFMDAEGIALSKRRITLSTSGVVPELAQVGEELNVNLAISLHAVHDELRDVLVPINKKYPLKVLMEACRNYPGLTNARRITWEYVMLKGVNDSMEDAKKLYAMLKGIPSKVNLIPFNPWPGSEYETSETEVIKRFSDFLFEKGISAPVRWPRGRDISAACGQLKSESQRDRRQSTRI